MKTRHEGTGAINFLDDPGGTGKTYLTLIILAKMRSVGNIVLATSASSGFAGRTTYYRICS